MLESETAGGVAGRSTTNSMHDNHVNNENNNRHDYKQYDNVNRLGDLNRTQMKTGIVDSFGN